MAELLKTILFSSRKSTSCQFAKVTNKFPNNFFLRIQKLQNWLWKNDEPFKMIKKFPVLFLAIFLSTIVKHFLFLRVTFFMWLKLFLQHLFCHKMSWYKSGHSMSRGMITISSKIRNGLIDGNIMIMYCIEWGGQCHLLSMFTTSI